MSLSHPRVFGSRPGEPGCKAVHGVTKKESDMTDNAMTTKPERKAPRTTLAGSLKGSLVGLGSRNKAMSPSSNQPAYLLTFQQTEGTISVVLWLPPLTTMNPLGEILTCPRELLIFLHF